MNNNNYNNIIRFLSEDNEHIYEYDLEKETFCWYERYGTIYKRLFNKEDWSRESIDFEIKELSQYLKTVATVDIDSMRIKLQGSM